MCRLDVCSIEGGEGGMEGLVLVKKTDRTGDDGYKVMMQREKEMQSRFLGIYTRLVQMSNGKRMPGDRSKVIDSHQWIRAPRFHGVDRQTRTYITFRDKNPGTNNEHPK